MSEQIRGSEREVERSVEEEDSVRRSTKKKKDSHPPGNSSEVEGSFRSPSTNPSYGPSYKDKLLGEIPGAYEQAFFGTTMDDDRDITDEEDVEPVEGEAVVFGRSVGYLFLVNKLRSLWRNFGEFSCVDLGYGFFLVRFESKDDFESILKGRPWFIGDHFLSVRPWVPDFKPSEASVSSIAVWIRLPELPVEYYDKGPLLLIGGSISPVLRVDYNTASGSRGRFARICIQIDLEKPLIRTLRLGKIRQAIVYEGINALCFTCGIIGHKKEACPIKPAVIPVPEQTSTPPPDSGGIQATDRDGELFGPWMLVTRRKRQGRQTGVGTAGKIVHGKEPVHTPYVYAENTEVPLMDVPRMDSLFVRKDSVPRRNNQNNRHADKNGSLIRKTGNNALAGLELGPNSVGSDWIAPTGFGPNGTVIFSAGASSSKAHSPNSSTYPNFRSKFSTPVVFQAPQTSTVQLSLPSLPNEQPRVSRGPSPPGPNELGDLAWRSNRSNRRRHRQSHSPGPPSRVGMVQQRGDLGLGRNSSETLLDGSSTSTATHGPSLATRSQPLLELPLGSSKSSRTEQSVEDSKSAIAGAPINSISRGGVSVNLSRVVRREEGHDIAMNVLTWNCRGVLNPCFRRALNELIKINNPDILILTETRLGGTRAAELAATLPFAGFLCTKTIGFAGGIWCLWKSDALELDHLCSTEQEIHVSVKVKDSNSSWLLSAIYASPRQAERRILWRNLSIIAANHDLPWVMIGDFNDIMSSEEKWGGNVPSHTRISEYRDCMNKCNMIDLGFSGPKYTWSNLHDISSLIMQRLDRAWANPSWSVLFPNALVTHLPRFHSDPLSYTCSLFVTILFVTSLRPFRFENMWLSHPDFMNVVIQAWSCSTLCDSINSFTHLVTSWNRHTFGNIFKRKRRVLNRLNGIQHALACSPSVALACLEKSIRLEFLTILDQEEEFWALKSRLGWVLEGDRNTKFFHTSTIVRRKFNKIVRIRNSVGGWLENGLAACLSDTEALNIGIPVSPLEIKNALWSFKPFKAPGPDGLHPGFFQQCWHHVGPSVVREVSSIFTRGKMPEFLNSTLISLIPKCLGPEVFGHFRSISLCNTVYKVVTKIIVNRIRPLLGQLVSPYQAAFVPGRRGVDNVIIAQEMIHSMSKKRGASSQFAVKIDLEKAYDRLEWSFIREVLLFFKFPLHLVNLILDCVSSSSISILLNGGRLPPFKPSRGISETCDLGKYLGFPLKLSGWNFRDFNFIVEKVQAKLASWKAKLLSPAGRVVLIQSSSTDEKKKMHMVGWSKRLLEERDAIWAKTLSAKYLPNGPVISHLPTHKCGSSNWRALRAGHEVFRNGLRWAVNNGSNVSFWFDKWVGNCPLRNLVHGPLTQEDESFKVCDLVSDGGLWDLGKLSISIPVDIIQLIKGIHLSSFSPKSDSIVWDDPGGQFLLSNAYQLALGNSDANLPPISASVPDSAFNSFHLPFHDWVHINCSSMVSHSSLNLPWQTLFAFGLWTLWLFRNQAIFNPSHRPPDLLHNSISLASKLFYLSAANPSPAPKKAIISNGNVLLLAGSSSILMGLNWESRHSWWGGFFGF
uniref:CCHC-type domain-containing protein n=1 Tax=Fagus sylvatica TaxID=28930 RepID=A0A2N9FS20_FAGSY